MARIPSWVLWVWVAVLPVAACGARGQLPSTTALAPASTTPPTPSTPVCSDESGPSCWLHRLESPATRPSAIAHFKAVFDRASKQPDHGKALIDQIVEPLTRTYVDHYSDLDVKSRVKLIRLLAELKDKRTAPALAKAFDEYARHPPTDFHVNDIEWAALAQADLRLASVDDSLLRAFLAFHVHTMLGGFSYPAVNAAIVAAPQKSWTGPLLHLLAAKMVVPKSARDRARVDAYRDQLFWQTTAAEALGELREPQAVRALLRVMLDPTKADVQTTSVLALVKIGKPAEDAAIKLLKGEDAGLVAFSRKRAAHPSKGKPWVRSAALVLGTIGRSDAAGPMVDVLGHTSDAVDKAIIARSLTNLPASKKTERAFEHAYDSTAIAVVIPPEGAVALDSLSEAARSFRDPDMVPWLLGRAARTRGSHADLAALRGKILITALELAKANQIRSVKRAVDAYGTKLEKDAYALASKLLAKCGNRVACYLDAVGRPGNQKQATQFAGIKAATMVGVLGNEHSAGLLVDRLDSVDNPAVRYTAAMSIDHLLPRGSSALADKLAAIVIQDDKSGNRTRIMGDAPLKQVSYRIGTRAR